MSRRQLVPTLSATLLAALLVAGCGSSGGGSGGKDLGALAGVNAIDGKAQRQNRRAKAKAAEVSTSQLRYLDRLAKRRAARGLPVPASLRVAYRRERYSDEPDPVKVTKSLLKKVTNPVTRLIPFANQNKRVNSTTKTHGTTANTSKRSMFKSP